MNKRMARRCGVAAVMVGVMVGLVACLPVPLGDPAKAVADQRYVGAWHWKEEGGRTNLANIRQWDERTFVIDVFMFDGDLSSPSPKGRAVYKGWLADLKGKTFLSMQQIEFLSPYPGEKRQRHFLVAKVELAGDQLTATALDGGYDAFKTVTTTTELEKVITQNMDDVKMWAKPIVASKLGEGQMDSLEKLAKKFEEMKVD